MSRLKLRLQTENDLLYQNGKKLELKGRQVQSLPADLWTLTSITTLDMSASRETDLNVSIKTLPAQIYRLRNLRCLHLDINNIKSIDHGAGSPPHFRVKSVC